MRNWEFGVSLWGTSGEFPGLRNVAIVCAFCRVIDSAEAFCYGGKLWLFREVEDQIFEDSQVVRDCWAGRDPDGSISVQGLESSVREMCAMEKSHRRRLLEEESTAYAL